ncbi:NACHT domain-containing protein [Streptomyces sp. MB09-01]|uniref:NACHT domain-containing protein n=1 Tax=Streptomyces sp. MB09-01 TaxID=3028666 RepID=UPI0029A9F238|nr:NACHT domain-containing protein [Streptomyces sp. MB09-01]MDX3537423.1 NACHT domain-containing protein [Streptomyces sp. MB09-01]
MTDRATTLYAELSALERRAKAARRVEGLPYSRRETAKALRGLPEGVSLNSRRISDWLPGDPAKAVTPSHANADAVWALVCLWSHWARVPPHERPSRRYVNDLVEAAQPERRPAPTVAPSLPARLRALLERQSALSEDWPYVLHEGSGSLLPLSMIHVRQQLDGATDPDGDDSGDSDGDNDSDGLRYGPDAQGPAPAQPLERLLSNDAYGHLLLEAGPGGGKSSLLARLAGDMSDAFLRQEDPHLPPVIPLWATASALSAHPHGVEDALARPLSADHSVDEPVRFHETVADLLHPPARWLVLVDGLDELPDPNARANLVHRLTRLARETAVQSEERVRIVITSRPMQAPERRLLETAGFTPRTLAPFHHHQLRELAERWSSQHEHGATLAAEFLGQVELARLRDLVRVPLLAAVAIALYEAWPDRALPSNQYALYEQYRLYLTAAKAQHRGARLGGLATLSLRNPAAAAAVRFLEQNFDDLLREVAHAARVMKAPDLHQHAIDWLAQKLGPAARVSIPGWRDAVAGLLTSTGLIVSRNGRLRFLHISFAEHLAAEHDAWRLPVEFSPQVSSWQEVVLSATRPRGRRTRHAMATLLHYCHLRPLSSAALLSWLQQGSDRHHRVAARLLAEGCPASAQHVRDFLDRLPYLPAECWESAGHLADEAAYEMLVFYASSSAQHRATREHALDALALRRPGEALRLRERLGREASPPRHDAPTAAPHAKAVVGTGVESVLQGFGRADVREQADILGAMILTGELEPADRSAIAQALCAAAPDRARQVADRLETLARDTARTPWARHHAVEALLDFGGSHVGTAAAVLLALATQPDLSPLDRWDAAESVLDLGAPHTGRARRIMRALLREPGLSAGDLFDLQGRQHDPDLAGAPCARHGAAPLSYQAGDDDLPDDLAGVDALVVTGGAAPIRSGGNAPAHDAELELLRGALARELPVLGLGLGARLLAVAAGGTVVHRAGSAPEQAGRRPVRTAPASGSDPLFAGIAAELPAARWGHDGTVELPADALVLASDDRRRVHAFRIGASAWGLHLPLEATAGTEASDAEAQAWGPLPARFAELVADRAEPTATRAFFTRRADAWEGPIPL